MRWNIIVECVQEDGNQDTIRLGAIERLAGSPPAETLGVNLQASKQIVNRLQGTVAEQQLQEQCEQRQKCDTCGRRRPIKDFRCRWLDTVLDLSSYLLQGAPQQRRLSPLPYDVDLITSASGF
jgi:hypothetical protein